jgi:hypothetical protein
MKISIIGEKARAATWEKHLRKLSAIDEVTFIASLGSITETDAVFLIDESDDCLTNLYDSVRSGYHTYLISKLPVDPIMLEKIYASAQESGVVVQFSHWPSLSESVQWIHQKIEKPDLIQINRRTVPVNHRVIDFEDFEHHWIDEIALIVKWMGGNVHRYEIKPVRLGGMYAGLSATLRFENSTVADLQYIAASDYETHQRIFSNRLTMVDADVLKQTVRVHTVNDLGRITLQKKSFDPSDTAERSVVQFIKAIQLKQWTLFSPYEALQTSKIISKIRSLMNQNH